jgi:hypothetical protein
MSIQSEINRVKQNVTDTYSALSEMGATMPEEQNSDNLAATARTVPAGGGSSVQSDWNQTDETAADFIKNKPFGEKEAVMVDEQTFMPSADGALLEYVIAPEIGAEIKIVFDGESHTYTVENFMDIGVGAGNLNLVFGEEGNGDPCFVVWVNGVCMIMTIDQAEIHTVKVTGEVTTKLPVRYYEAAVVYAVNGDNGEEPYIYKNWLFTEKVTADELLEALAHKQITLEVASASDASVFYGYTHPFYTTVHFQSGGSRYLTVHAHKEDGTVAQYYTAEYTPES